MNSAQDVRTNGDTQQLEKVQKILRELETVVVAYSGGVDSSLVLYLAVRVLGRENVVAAVADSASLPERDRTQVRKFADSLGVRLELLATKELEDPRYAANPVNRCFFCKDELYTRFAELAVALGFKTVADGTNADDIRGHRPGLAAAKKAGVRSPLLEAGVGKKAVRSLARMFGIPVWNKPAAACLASRIPYNTPVTADVLRQIDRAEQVLQDEGFATVRVRHHGEIARIEVEQQEIARLLQPELRRRVTAALQAIGYRYVTVDLEGYRSGRLNETEMRQLSGH